ncbi:hypothetical protein H5U35_03910 [Candidatus Aerophobetes bacterium]|nr:hypothetical protein [Candidatus Aerophobetes bacterium]
MSVVFILQLLALGMSVDNILKGYPTSYQRGYSCSIDYAADTTEHKRILKVG